MAGARARLQLRHAPAVRARDVKAHNKVVIDASGRIAIRDEANRWPYVASDAAHPLRRRDPDRAAQGLKPASPRLLDLRTVVLFFATCKAIVEPRYSHVTPRAATSTAPWTWCVGGFDGLSAAPPKRRPCRRAAYLPTSGLREELGSSRYSTPLGSASRAL